MIVPLIILGSLTLGEQTLFSGSNAGEGPFLLTYLDSIGVPASSIGSAGMKIQFSGAAAERVKILEGYKLKFGVDLTTFDKNGFSIIKVPECTMAFSPPSTTETILKSLSKNSMLCRAITKCTREYHLTSSDNIKSIKYYIHPVMLTKSQRGEYLKGSLEVVQGGRSQDYWLSETQ